MVAFIAIATGLALLVATVYGLHRYQTMEVEYNVDRSIPLPPIDQKFPLNLGSNEPAVTTRRSWAPFTPAEPEEIEFKPVKSGSNWQRELLAAKERGDLERAAQICEQQFPLWSAYNQACIILRGHVADAEGEYREQLLLRLYRLAALAEFLHDKTVASTRLSVNQLKELDLRPLEGLRLDYAELGYAHLRLLRKHDIKLMVEFWGKPQRHLPPRELHLGFWQEIVDRAS